MESTFPIGILEQAESLLNRCREKGLRLATAESCTGGLIAAACTEIPGSSDVFSGGIVAYSNEVKTTCLGVPEALLSQHGAVSEQVASTMAEGALARLNADIAISVTGIAGPGGGSVEKPVGLVYIAVARDGAETECQHFEFGDIGRAQVRWRTVEAALEMASAAI